MAVGIAQAAYEKALSYAQERKQFGKSISRFQAIQFKLADMAMKIELARNMVYKAAWLKDQGKPFTKEAAMCKLYASEICMESSQSSCSNSWRLWLHEGISRRTVFTRCQAFRNWRRNFRNSTDGYCKTNWLLMMQR